MIEFDCTGERWVSGIPFCSEITGIQRQRRERETIKNTEIDFNGKNIIILPLIMVIMLISAVHGHELSLSFQ